VAGRTPNEALVAFATPIREALGCFAKGRVSYNATAPGDDGLLLFNNGADVVLNPDLAITARS
jgi:hypothetical protein